MNPSSDPDAVQVRFAIELDSSHLLQEDDPALQAWPAGRLDVEALSGQWRIGAPALAQPLLLADDLLNLAHGLGVQGAAALRAGRAHRLPFATIGGAVELVPEGERTRLLVPGQVPAELPTAALADALLACAGRLAATLRALGGDDEDLQAAARELAQAVAAQG